MSEKKDRSVKVSSKVSAEVWEEFRTFARESHRSMSGLLSEALREFLARRRVRPVVMRHLEDSIRDNEELGRRLAE